MQPRPSTRERWLLSAAVLLPIILALLTAAAAVLGFVFWSADNIDARALDRQHAMVSRAIEARRQSVQHDLESIAIRDGIAGDTGPAPDFSWADLGLWMYDVFGHDRTVVLDAASAPLHVMEGGTSLETTAFAQWAPAVLPLVERLRSIRRPPPDAPVLPTAVADFAVIAGLPAIVSARSIGASAEPGRPDANAAPALVAVLFLDGAAANQLNREYLFDGGRFSLVASQNARRAVHPILNAAGRFVAFFEWDPYRPGFLILRHAGPALTAAFIVAAILLVLLLRQLHRSSTALEAGRRLAEHQAAHDMLTGLPNRMHFDTRLAAVLADGQLSSPHLALLMLDLDRFKQVNDTLGHQAGDELIRAVGDRLRLVIGGEVMIARLGGDEFGILAVSPDEPLDVMAVSARIIDAIAQPFALRHFTAHVGVSIGIVITQRSATLPSELMRKADIALYEAKASGRNRAVVYEEHMNEELQLQHTIEGELREALRQGDQLSVVFQPLVDQQSRKVIGAEALARWHHPKYGHISPARFIPVAENTGLIEALGDFVLRRACDLGASVPGRTIAVNISPTQLRNPRFSHQVFDILRETGMRPLDLELEITESILLDDEHISSQNLRTFRTAGVHIALDDFGTGYSSLSYLKRYPVDRIKIDRSFVNQLADGHVSVAITQAIVTLAHAMNIEVTAEGVETEPQAAILARLGCNTLQGFLFSGGVPPQRIMDIFADVANAPGRRRRRIEAA